MLKAGNSRLLNFQTVNRKNLKIGDMKTMPQKTNQPCEHLSKQFVTTTFTYMASSDDVTNGESHSKLQMARAYKSFANLQKITHFWNQRDILHQIRSGELYFLKKVFIGGQPTAYRIPD